MFLITTAPPFDDFDFHGPWYVSPDDVPVIYLDTVDPDTQGDDRVYKPGTTHFGEQHFARLGAVNKAPATIRIVPLHREVKLGTIGVDSVAVKRALAKLGLLGWTTHWTQLFGPYALRALRRFQQTHGLHVDGVYGLATHKKVVSLGGFDRYGAYLMGTAPYPISPQQQLRNRIVANAMWGYHNRDHIHYAQWRPIDGHGHPYRLPLYTDCSGSIEDWYEWANGPDPSGLGFDGQGYTGTQIDHGVAVSHPQGGDLNFYGWDYNVHGPMHVTIQVSSSDKTDLCVSHGNEAGPSLVQRKYWSAYYTSRSYV